MTIAPDAKDWHEVAQGYTLTPESFSIGLAEEIAEILSAAGFSAPRSMLEAGAGSGHLSLLLRQAGYQTDLLDFEPLAIDKCRDSFRQAFGAAGDESRFIVGDLTKLTEAVPEKSYDVVWNSGVLEHFSNMMLRDAFARMGAVARQAVFFIVPNSQSLIYLAYRQKMLEHNRWGFGVEFLRDDYESLAEAAGLTVLKSGYCGRGYTRNFLEYTLEGAPAADFFGLQLAGGQLASQLCLKYYILAPEPSGEANGRAREIPDDHATIDKTYYLDSLGAANAASVRMRRQLDDLSTQMAALARERDQARDQLAYLEQQSRELARLEGLAVEKESLILSLNARIAEKNHLIETLSAEKENLALSMNARLAEKNQLIETLSAEKENLALNINARIADKNQLIETLSAEKENLALNMNARLAEKNQLIETLSTEKENLALNMNARIADKNQLIETLSAEREDLRQRLFDAEHKRDAYHQRIQALEENLAERAGRCNELVGQVDQLRASVDEKVIQAERLQRALAEAYRQFDRSRQGWIETVQGQIGTLRAHLSAQMDDNAAMLERLQGALAGGRWLFEHTRQNWTAALQHQVDELRARLVAHVAEKTAWVERHSREVAAAHESMNAILNQAMDETRRVNADLEFYYHLRRYRLAHFLGLVRANLFSGPLGERFRFLGRVLAKCLGRYPGQIAQENPLLVPMRQTRQLEERLTALNAQCAALSQIAGAQSVEPLTLPSAGPVALELPPAPFIDDIESFLQPLAYREEPALESLEQAMSPVPRLDDMQALLKPLGKDNPVPAPEPIRVAPKLPRRPHGKRRVAYMTNQLVDWRDQRPRFGGGERYAVSLATMLRELGLEVHFFQPAFTACEATYEGFPVTCLPIGSECYSEFYHEFCTRFTRLTADYDHVLHNMPEFSSGATRQDALMICHGIWFDHNNYTNTKFRTTEWYRHLGRAFGNPRQIVSVDTNSINYIRAIWPELAPRMHYIPNFFNSDEFKPDPALRNPDKLTILFPRRSQINRGSRILEAILNRVPYDVRFCWVGEGDREDTEMIKDLCKRDTRLSFHAAVFSEMAQWYQKADITVIPTIACEGTSLSCLEALACGSATISTNVGGLSDLVQNGTNGILVDPRPEEIAAAINHLIEDEADRLRLEKVGPESVRPFELQAWRRRWAAVLAEQNWAPVEAFENLGLLSNPATSKTTSVTRCEGVDLSKKRVGIITKNGIHGGVESIIAFESRLLNAPVIVAGGIDQPETCPFPYTRADDYESLAKALGNFDVVLYHWLPDYAVQAISDFGIPSVEYVHRVDTCDCDKTVPTEIMAHSNFLAEFVTEEFDHACWVVEYPIDTETYTPQPELGNCIGAVTSYYNIKGLDVFLRAWAMIKDEFPDVPARFYGQGADLESLKELARELGVEVEFRPPVKEPWKVLPEFRCFVLPSRLEGLPMASLEALSMELPVVASDIDGFVEFNALARLRGLEHGFEIFKMDDPVSMAEAMRKVLNNPVRPRTHDYIERHFGLAHHRRNCEAVLKAALRKGNNGPRMMTCRAVWQDEKHVGDPATTLGVYYIKVGETFETIFPGDVEAMRRTTLANDYYLCFHVQLPEQLRALEWQVIADREARLGWQIDWFDADKNYLGYSANSAQVYPGKMHGCLDKNIPAGACFAKVTLRPIPGESFKVEKLRLRGFI